MAAGVCLCKFLANPAFPKTTTAGCACVTICSRGDGDSARVEGPPPPQLDGMIYGTKSLSHKWNGTDNERAHYTLTGFVHDST